MPLRSPRMFPGYIKYHIYIYIVICTSPDIYIYIYIYAHLLNPDIKFPFVWFLLAKWQTYPLLWHIMYFARYDTSDLSRNLACAPYIVLIDLRSWLQYGKQVSRSNFFVNLVFYHKIRQAYMSRNMVCLPCNLTNWNHHIWSVKHDLYTFIQASYS
jgi:hypothetical protein